MKKKNGKRTEKRKEEKFSTRQERIFYHKKRESLEPD